jgi:electron transfer flavoprotein alpha subunit
MSVSSQTWIVVADDPAVSGLVVAARTLGGEVTAVVAGRRATAEAVAASGVDRVLWLGEPAEGTPVEAYAPDVARTVAAGAPGAVLGSSDGAGRVLLGAIAALLQAPVLSGVTALERDGDQIGVTRGVFGGIAERRDLVIGGTAVIALAGGEISDPADPTAPAAPVEEVTANALTTGRLTGLRPKEKAPVNLRAARTVVAVGRGLKAQDDLALITDLADAIGGELACSRPLAEGVHWIAKERNIGISGQQIAPGLYVAVGISGQLQHMVGVRDAGVIVAVNSDKDALIFKQCDYGIVGDLYTVVPALTAALAPKP